MIPRCIGGAEVDDRLRTHTLVESLLGPVLQNIAQLYRVVGLEYHDVKRQRALDPRIHLREDIRIIGEAYEASGRVAQFLVQSRKDVQGVVAPLLQEIVHLVQDDYHNAKIFLDTLQKLGYNHIGGETGERKPFVPIGYEGVCNGGQYPVFGIDMFAVDVNVFDVSGDLRSHILPDNCVLTYLSGNPFHR